MTAAPAHAQDARAKAVALKQDAIAKRTAGDARGALASYRSAYELFPSPLLLWPIAELCLELHLSADGLDALARYRDGVAEPDRPSGQREADITVLELRLRAVDVKSEPETPPSPEPAKVVATPEQPAQPAVTVVAKAPHHDLLRTLGYVTVGGGALFLAGGIAGQIVRYQQINQYNDDSQCLVNGLTRGENCGGPLNNANIAQSLAITGYVIGGALLATGTGLLIASRSKRDRAACILQPGPAALGMACAGTF